MSQIKESIKKIQAASALLEKNMQQPLSSNQNMRSLHNVLTEINANVEELKHGVSAQTNSPIRLKG